MVTEYDGELTSPDRSIVGKVVSAVKTLIEGTSAATEIAVHGHEWLHAATHFVSTLPASHEITEPGARNARKWDAESPYSGFRGNG